MNMPKSHDVDDQFGTHIVAQGAARGAAELVVQARPRSPQPLASAEYPLHAKLIPTTTTSARSPRPAS